MSDHQFWQVSEEAGVFWLKIHRPDKKNAFNPQVVDELGKILVDLGKNPAVQILVLTTTQDEMFCAGADIEWFYGLGEPDGAMASIVAQDVFDLMEKVPFPVIAAIKGLNLTAGFELMLACDMIIAADNAKFGQIETKYGLTPGGGGTQRLARLVGPLKAREMIYTAKIISAEEALKIGLVNEVVPLAEIDNRVRQLCKEIMKNSRAAVKESKLLINLSIFSNDTGFKAENKAFGFEFGSGEPKERFGAFLKKK